MTQKFTANSGILGSKSSSFIRLQTLFCTELVKLKITMVAYFANENTILYILICPPYHFSYIDLNQVY